MGEAEIVMTNKISDVGELPRHIIRYGKKWSLVRYSFVKRNLETTKRIKDIFGLKRIIITVPLFIHEKTTSTYRNLYVMYEREVK